MAAAGDQSQGPKSSNADKEIDDELNKLLDSKTRLLYHSSVFYMLSSFAFNEVSCYCESKVIHFREQLVNNFMHDKVYLNLSDAAIPPLNIHFPYCHHLFVIRLKVFRISYMYEMVLPKLNSGC